MSVASPCVFVMFISNKVLLFNSEKSCQNDMYMLVFVMFWITVSFCGCCLCCVCVGASASALELD